MKRRWKRTTDSNDAEPMAPNRLQQDLSASAEPSATGSIGAFPAKPWQGVFDSRQPAPVDFPFARGGAFAGECFRMPLAHAGGIQSISCRKTETNRTFLLRRKADVSTLV